MERNAKITPLRSALLFVLLGPVAAAIFVAASAAVSSNTSAGFAAVVAAIVAGRMLLPHLPFDAAWSGGRGRALFALWLVVGLYALLRVGSMSVFMIDVNRSDYGVNPTVRAFDDAELSQPFYPTHNCFTCYIVAAHLASERKDNLYDRKFYRGGEVRTPIHEQIGESLYVDSYQYPPPFLILPRLLMATGGGFYQLRAYWFALNLVAFTMVMLALLLWIGGPRFNAHWLAMPALLAAPAMLGTLQIQNTHLLIILISLAALPAFQKRWHGLGGALLGFAIVSKLFPGLLLVFLLLQRRWRAVFWTGGWMIVYCAITLVLFGPLPFEAFLTYQMPRLADGEAFSFATTYLAPLVKNCSMLGVAYKLEKLGLLSDPKAAATQVLWTYTALLGVALLVVGLRRRCWTDGGETQSGQRLALAQVWLAVLILGQLRSPFLPWTYGNIAVLLLLILLLPARMNAAGGRFATAFLIAAWVMLAVSLPLPFGPPTVTPELIYTLVALGITLALCAAVVLRKPPIAA